MVITKLTAAANYGHCSTRVGGKVGERCANAVPLSALSLWAALTPTDNTSCRLCGRG